MASVMSIPMNTAHAIDSQPIVFHMVPVPLCRRAQAPRDALILSPPPAASEILPQR